jgi:mono/diheme cytochrome c family protein
VRRFVAGCAALLLAALVISCGPKVELAESQSDGQRLFRANCRSCHRLPNPKSKTDSEWPSLVNRYGERAKLSPEQIDLIIAYLQAAN